MANFFKKKEQRKSRKTVLHEEAKKILATVEEKVDDVSSANEVAERTLKEAQDFITANSEANKISELSPEKKERATELLRTVAKLLIDNDKIPDEAAGEFVKNLIQNDSKVVGVAVAEEASFIPDDQLKEIIDIPEVGVKDAERIITGINNTETRNEVQEELDLAKLRELYKTCENISKDSEFITKLSKIQSENIGSQKIDEMIKKVVAKRVAVYYAKLKAVTVNRYTDVLSPVQMLECDLTEMSKQEYKNLKIDEDQKREFDSKTCKMMIIDKLADNIVTQYTSQPAEDRVLLVPESPAIRSFTREDEDELVEQIRIKCENKNNLLKNYQLQNIRNQIHGYKKTEEVESLSTSLETISNPDLRRKCASDFEQILSTFKCFSDKDQEKMMDLLVTMSEKVAEKVESIQEKNQDIDNKNHNKFGSLDDNDDGR